MSHTVHGSLNKRVVRMLKYKRARKLYIDIVRTLAMFDSKYTRARAH